MVDLDEVFKKGTTQKPVRLIILGMFSLSFNPSNSGGLNDIPTLPSRSSGASIATKLCDKILKIFCFYCSYVVTAETFQ